MMMRLHILILFLLSGLTMQAQPRLLPDAQPQVVFGGGQRTLELRWCNPGDTPASLEISNNLLQADSATVAPWNLIRWKTLSMLPKQTVLESAQVDFPAVKARTEFLVQWLVDTNHILGVTRVMVYPTNLLGELQLLTKDHPPGVLDPDNQLKPLLKQNQVDFTDLDDTVLDDFHGRLAILGPFDSKAQQPKEIARRCKAMLTNGTSVLWLVPPAEQRDQLQPSYYSVISDTNAVVVVQPCLVKNLVDDPRSQLRLLKLCRQALQPAQPTLADLSDYSWLAQ